jgi:RNA-binding protein
MKNNLSKDKRKQLQKKASTLKPIIMIGQKGLTDSVLAEIDSALNIHELIKIRSRGVDKDECKEQRLKIEQHLNADVVHRIGFITVFYRTATNNK